MTELLDCIGVRFPGVARECREFAAKWLAEEAALLEPNHVLLRSKDDILPGLSQAIWRRGDIELTEMAQVCGLNANDLRITVALSRLGELLKPGEISNLSDQELDSRLRQAAREYGLESDELLEEICDPSPVVRRSLPTQPRTETFSVGGRLRCWVCRRLRPQYYRLDFTGNAFDDVGDRREPVYACPRCLPTHLVSHKVQQITRLSAVNVPNSSGARIRSAVFVAVLILVCCGLYARAKGTVQKASGVRVTTTSATTSLPNEMLGASGTKADHNNSPARSRSSAAAADSSGLGLAPFSMEIVPDSTIVRPSQVASGSDESNNDDYQSMLPSAKVRSVHPAEEIPQLRDSNLPVWTKAKALDHCRQVLHSERPLMRQSVQDTMKEADQNAIPMADACIRRLNNLTVLGNTCSDSFRWFEAFQTTLIIHVKRVCREATRKHTDTEILTTRAR